MKVWIATTLGCVFGCCALAGCGSGTMPEGPSPSEIRATVNAMPPQQQIDFYKHSPMKAEDKAAKIAEIEKKYGVKDSGAAPASPGAPPGAADASQ